MSRRSSRKKWRRMEALRRKEQVALQEDKRFGEETEATIGQSVDRLYKQRNAAILNESISLQKMPASQTQLPSLPPVVTRPAVWPQHWPVCPATCDPTEWQLALENRDYYLKKVKDGGNTRTWFQYPKRSNQYSEFVYLTPEMAQELLAHMPINRRKKPHHVERLRRDIINHRWLQTHESICINKLGNMQDGQHRADAVIKANMGWPLYHTWNVPPSGLYATDSGERRNENEKLALLFPDLKVTPQTAALARSMMSGLENRNIRYTGQEIAGFMIVHAKVMFWAMNSLKAYRADMQAVMAKALLWWGEGVVGPFVERLRTVQFQGDGDPAKALYLWLQRAKQQGKRAGYISPLIYYKKALSAVHLHASGKTAKRINAKERDVFEWLSGWKVPAAAPCGGKVFLNEEANEPLDI